MGRASQASSVAGPDRSYYLTKRTELGQLIMHAFKEPEVLGKITCSKEGFTINQDDKESKKVAARGNLHNSNKNDFTKGFYVRYNNNNSNTLYPNPIPPFFIHIPSFISTGHCSLVTQTLKVCGELLTIHPQMLIMLLQQPPSLQYYYTM